MLSMEELTFTGISLVFLLLGVVLIGSIVMAAFNPYERIAVANAEKLANAMDQLCEEYSTKKGDTSIKVQISIELPQSTPMFSNFFTVLSSWVMRSGGDPSYVIYYESFPPGEAIGWETYHVMNDRLYIRLPDNFDGKGLNDVVEYVKKEVEKFKTNNPGRPIDGAVVANLVLNSQYTGIFLDSEKENKEKETVGEGIKDSTNLEKQAVKSFPGFGKWQNDPTNSKNVKNEDVFKFDSYLGLSPLQKTFIKYETCGPYSLCLKTRNAVYRFPLEHCAGKIKTVQLVYDARKRDSIYTTVASLFALNVPYQTATTVTTKNPFYFIKGASETITTTTVKSGSVMSRLGVKTGLSKIASSAWATSKFGTISGASYGIYVVLDWVAGSFLSVKDSNLVLSSPCSIPVSDLQIGSCKKPDIKDVADYRICDTVISYPIYVLEEKTDKSPDAKEIITKLKYREEGEIRHYECSDKIEVKIDKEGEVNPGISTSGFKDEDMCVQLVVTERPKGFCWTPDPSTNDYALWNADTQLLSKMLPGITPVRDAVEYVSNSDMIVLRNTRNNDLEGFLKDWGRRLSWGWPGIS